MLVALVCTVCIYPMIIPLVKWIVEHVLHFIETALRSKRERGDMGGATHVIFLAALSAQILADRISSQAQLQVNLIS